MKARVIDWLLECLDRRREETEIVGLMTALPSLDGESREHAMRRLDHLVGLRAEREVQEIHELADLAEECGIARSVVYEAYIQAKISDLEALGAMPMPWGTP